MDGCLIKLKDNFKRLRHNAEGMIKQYRSEFELINEIKRQLKLINAEKKVGIVTNSINFDFEELEIKLGNYIKFLAPNESLEDLIEGSKSGNPDKFLRFVMSIYEFGGYIEHLKDQVNTLREAIVSFDNDKIKAPINDIVEFYCNLMFTTLSLEEFNRVFGMVIAFNSQYAKKHPLNKIKNIDIIDKLAMYYNLDGSFKINADIELYKELMNDLLKDGLVRVKKTFFDAGIFEMVTIDKLTGLLALEVFKTTIVLDEENIVVENKKSEEKSINLVDRTFIKNLRQYYKNGDIIAIPDNLEVFYQELSDSYLDEQEKKLIKKLMEQEVLNRKKSSKFKYLTDDDRLIYEDATKLLDSFNKSNPDIWELKQHLEDVQVVLEMLEGDISDTDRKELVNELNNIIERLSLLCDKYMKVRDNSTNRYIFLLDKDGVPCIFSDMNKLDVSYKKSVGFLIERIVPDNSSRFKPIKSNGKLEYQMYEYVSSNVHVSFIEIDAGIYVIIGADKSRDGYEDFCRRLRNNQLIIEQFEMVVKNSGMRNELLEEHQYYLDYIISSCVVSENKRKRRY